MGIQINEASGEIEYIDYADLSYGDVFSTEDFPRTRYVAVDNGVIQLLNDDGSDIELPRVFSEARENFADISEFRRCRVRANCRATITFGFGD